MASISFPTSSLPKWCDTIENVYNILMIDNMSAKYIKISYHQSKKIVYIHVYSVTPSDIWRYNYTDRILDINISGTGYEYTYTEDEDHPTHLEAYKNYNLSYVITNNSINPKDDPDEIEIITAEIFSDTFRKLFRNIGMEPAASDIPEEYTQVTAIKPASVTANCIIHTGIIPDTDNFKMELYIQTYSNAAWRIFNSHEIGTNPTNRIWGITGGSTGYICFCYGDANNVGNYAISNILRQQGQYILLKIIATYKSGELTLETHEVNNNIVDMVTVNFDFMSATKDICIFGDNNGNVVQTSGNLIYRARIWKDDVLVMDYVPVIRNSDSKPGFWDTVSKTFKTNDYIAAYGA